MLSINDGPSLLRALSTPLDPRLRHLLSQRRDQLGGSITGHARFVVVQPNDTLTTVEQAFSFSPLQNPIDGSRFGDPDFTPAWEWIEDHGFCFEVVFIFDDSGFAHVLLVEKAEGVDPQLIALCQAHASGHV
ncbi:MAG TPA: hypothetical protein VF655_13800 [Allosphingosinicella sp.]